MSEKLIIRDFAGIKDAEIELGQINILIGPQASGKSICAKLAYYFKSFLGHMMETMETEKTKRQFDADFLEIFQNFFPLSSFNKEFSLRYEINDTFIEVRQIKGKIKLIYSDYYTKELKYWQKAFHSRLEIAQEEDSIINHVSTIGLLQKNFNSRQMDRLGKSAAYSQVFIPAGRSFFAILQRTIFSFLSSNKAIDPFLIEFGSFYEFIKALSSRSDSLIRSENDRKLKTTIDNLLSSILQGKHIIENREDYLITPDDRKINLTNSSSGQQEMLPLALILSIIPFIGLWNTQGNVVYIEEPEAHLFPTAQYSIVKLIATVFNCTQLPVQFFITTHSPYILTAFNNLIQAGNLASHVSPEELQKLDKIVPQDQFIRSEDMRVYSLFDGTCQSILSSETGLIETTILDEVSDQLAIQFDKLLDIE